MLSSTVQAVEGRRARLRDGPEPLQGAETGAQRPPRPGSLVRVVAGWRVALVVLLLVLGGGAWLASPWLLWAYHVEQAGRFLDRGLAWPDPRYVDTLPVATDPAALERALELLERAVRWRPDHPHAYRLMGRVQMALGNWSEAAAALEQARQRAPNHPMIAWETGLVYEQMVRAIRSAPALPLTERLAAEAVLETPPVPIETPFCGDADEPSRCYAGRTSFRLPYAGIGDQVPVEYPTFFLHPPAKARLRLRVPPEQTALRFVLGLDPVAAPWGSDGATFQVWVEPLAGRPQMLFEHRMDRPEAVEGWVPGWADLSPWAGQEVVLVLGTGPGLSGDTTGDWYGWGNVALTTPEAARYALQVPQVRMRQAWLDGGFTGEAIVWRGDEARQAKRYEEALRWYERAVRSEPRMEGAVAYRRGLVYKALEQWDRAEAAFRAGAMAWPTFRDMWYELGLVLHEQGRYAEAIDALRRGVEAPQGQAVTPSTLLLTMGQIHRQAQAWEEAAQAYAEALAWDQFTDPDQRGVALYGYGLALRNLKRWEEARAAFAAFLELRPDHYWARIHQASVLQQMGRTEEAEALLRRAIELRPEIQPAYRALADLYATEGRVEEAIELYQQVLAIDPEDQGARQALIRLLARSAP